MDNKFVWVVFYPTAPDAEHQSKRVRRRRAWNIHQLKMLVVGNKRYYANIEAADGTLIEGVNYSEVHKYFERFEDHFV